MNNLNPPQTALYDAYDKAEAAIAKLENPTEESVRKAFSSISTFNSNLIVPFTGYYCMDGANGAFLSIDTVETYYRFTERITILNNNVTVTVSTDGTTSTTYNLDQTATFDGKTLIIPNVLNITLVRQYQAGVLTTFSGSVGGKPVTGSTRFNPITLPTFNGNYTDLTTIKKVLSVTDSGIAFDFGQGLQTIKLFTFTPLMFVLMFNNRNTGEKYVLMLGTAAGMGLACYIQHGTTGDYAVTIPPAGNS